MQPIRNIIHIDMDAFYASVEQRDRPELKGKPVIVGGDHQSRGVVAACSYEAREFGVHSAMASSTAYRLCPNAVFIPPRFDVYRAVSSDIRKIFCEYTDPVEPLSLDEAFLDVTENYIGIPSATLIAQEIKKKIYKHTGKLTASAGVSFNKFIAKPAIVLCAYRPGFNLFTSHRVKSHGENFREIRLQDLSLPDAQDMLESLLETNNIPADLKRLVQSKAEGNPFYLEELINSLIESGMLVRDNGNWKITRPIAETGISSSIHGLIISGRLDRLETGAKRILQEASSSHQKKKHLKQKKSSLSTF